MIRVVMAGLLLALGLGLALAAGGSGMGGIASAQQAGRPALLPLADQTRPGDPAALPGSDRISRDLVGREVQIRDIDEHMPWSAWTFEEDEPREIEILDQDIAGRRATITVHLSTHDNQDVGGETTYVSGRLRLRYEQEDGKWTLRSIENLTLRSSSGGIST